jgi:hypothetical protein
MEKKNMLRMGILLVIGLFVALVSIPLALAADVDYTSVTATGSVLVEIDSDSDSTTQIFSVSHNGGTELFRIQENGRVGIGITSPSCPLHVYKNSGATNTEILNITEAYDGSNKYALTLNTVYDRDIGIIFKNQGNIKWNIHNDGPSATKNNGLHIKEAYDNVVLALAQSGRVGIGRTDKLSTLTVKGRSSFRLNGSCATSPSSNTVTGTSTKFLTEVGIGDRIWIPPSSMIKTVTAIASDTSLTVDSDYDSTCSSSQTDVYPSLFRVDDSSDNLIMLISDQGRISIGTKTPDYDFHVKGDGYFEDDLRVGGTTPSKITLNGNDMYINGNLEAEGSGGSYIHNLALGSFSPSGTSGNLITDGKLGIGTTSPDNSVEILSSTTPQLRITNTDATDYATFAVDTDGQLDITTVDGGGADGHICLVPDGYVGIGTTSPNTELHVNGDIKQQITSSNVAIPPTSGQLDTLFGSATSNGDGWTAYLKDSDSDSFYQIVAVGSDWYIFSATKA